MFDDNILSLQTKEIKYSKIKYLIETSSLF